MLVYLLACSKQGRTSKASCRCDSHLDSSLCKTADVLFLTIHSPRDQFAPFLASQSKVTHLPAMLIVAFCTQDRL